MFPKNVVLSVVALSSFALQPSSQAQQFRSARPVNTPIPVGEIYGSADVNGDGRPDLVVSAFDPTASSGEVVVMLQNANGTFAFKAATGVPVGTTIIADLNGDKKPDLVTVNPGPVNDHGDPLGPATMVISYGNGDGTFRVQPPINLPGDELQPWVLAVDLNHDGRMDIVTVAGDQYGDAIVQSFLNKGNGTFAPAASQSGFIDGHLLTAGDFDGDGNGDVVINNDFQTEILLGNGDGTFREGSTIPSVNPTAVAVGDLNRDHHQDLVVLINGAAIIMLGKGNGSFQTVAQLNSSFEMPEPATGFAASITGNDAYVGDFNHDGIPDVAIATSSSSQAVEIWYGKGNGTFSNPKVFNLSTAYGNFRGVVAFADFNRDGQIDVAVRSASVGVVIANGSADGGFNAPVIAQSANSGSIAKADFNGDGIEDIAVVDEQVCQNCTHTGTLVQVFLGTGKGYFARPKSYTIPVDWGSIAVGDINRDGKPDIVVTRNAALINGGIASHYSTPDLTVMLGRGDGTFESPVSTTLLGAPSPGALSASTYLIDVNHDGTLDLVGDWGVALGNGAGKFSAPIHLPSGVAGAVAAMAPGDFRGSGRVDLAVATNTYTPAIDAYGPPEWIYILAGDGTGHFTVDSRRSTGFLDTLITADTNNDGLDDILYTDHSTDGTTNLLNLHVLLSSGTGAFSAPAVYSYPTSFDASDIVTGDFNRDGNVDVAVLGEFDGRGEVLVQLGTGTGVFNRAAQFYQGSMGRAVVLKVNADAAPDIVGTTTTGPARLLNTGKQ